jgi:hypothetical protein
MLTKPQKAESQGWSGRGPKREAGIGDVCFWEAFKANPTTIQGTKIHWGMGPRQGVPEEISEVGVSVMGRGSRHLAARQAGGRLDE